jgi:hypothetical protein
LKKNPTGIFGIENGIGIPLPMGVPEIGTENRNSQPTSQEGIVDLQKFIFDAQYVLYFQNSIFISQQYIVLRFDLIDLTKIYF